MRIFFAPEQLLPDPKQEFAAGGFRPAMEVQERATSVLAAIEAAAAGPVAVPADYGLQPVARVHDPNLLAFLNSADAQWSQTFPQTHPYPGGRLQPEKNWRECGGIPPRSRATSRVRLVWTSRARKSISLIPVVIKPASLGLARNFAPHSAPFRSAHC